MARFRVETVVEPTSGRIYAELYYPEDEQVALAKTGAIYATHEEAEKAVLRMFEEAFGNGKVE